MTIRETNEGGSQLADDQPDAWLACARNAAAHAVRAGDFAPTFRLPDVHGGNQALIDLIEQGPLVLSFYRGIWCDFCDAALKTLGGLDGKIRELGAMQIAIGPRPANDAERSRLQAHPMPLLVDRALKVTTAYGLAITLPDHLQERYARLGYAPAKTADGGEWKIPVPATYVIGRDGRVAMAMIDADYRTRIPSGHLLSALRGLRALGAGGLNRTRLGFPYLDRKTTVAAICDGGPKGVRASGRSGWQGRRRSLSFAENVLNTAAAERPVVRG